MTRLPPEFPKPDEDGVHITIEVSQLQPQLARYTSEHVAVAFDDARSVRVRLLLSFATADRMAQTLRAAMDAALASATQTGPVLATSATSAVSMEVSAWTAGYTPDLSSAVLQLEDEVGRRVDVTLSMEKLEALRQQIAALQTSIRAVSG